MHHKLGRPIVGFILSLALTLIAYFIMINPESFELKTAVLAIFVLALVQSLIQLIFFIHVWKEGGTYWNSTVFASTATIIFVVVFFSIWIINHLNYNMM